MRAQLAVLAIVLAMGAASAAAAQSMSGMKDMPGMSTTASAAKHGSGTGVIKAIDPKGAITLQHGPIPAVSWPAMTMTFKAKAALLKGLKVGQTVGFDCEVAGMSATVTAVRSR
jgi:Cu(I)/Ag(I) efflux system protein CusF